MTCQRIGRPPISTSGFGTGLPSPIIRVPLPPHRMATGVMGGIMRSEDECLCGEAAPDHRYDLGAVESKVRRQRCDGAGVGPVLGSLERDVWDECCQR